MRLELGESDAAEGRGRIDEAAVDDALMQTEDVEEMRSAIAVDDRDAHLRHDLRKAGIERLQHTVFAGGAVATGGRQCHARFEGKPWTDGTSAIADEDGGVVNVAAVAGLDRDAGKGAQAGRHQRLMHRAGGHRHGHRDELRACGTVGQQKKARAVADQLNGAVADDVERRREG